MKLGQKGVNYSGFRFTEHSNIPATDHRRTAGTWFIRTLKCWGKSEKENYAKKYEATYFYTSAYIRLNIQ